MVQKILVATDGSASSDQATRLALELDVTHSAKVMALNVIDTYPFIGMGTINPVAAVSAGILQTSKEQDCDLIVIGSHGRGHLGRLLLGSVATKVVHESSIPVLIS